MYNERINLIEKVVCRMFGTDNKSLKSNTRKGFAPFYRHIVFYFIKKYVKQSDKLISELYDTERSNVNVSVRKIKTIVDTDKFHPFKKKIEMIDIILSKNMNFDIFFSNFITEVADIEDEFQFKYLMNKYNELLNKHDYQT